MSVNDWATAPTTAPPAAMLQVRLDTSDLPASEARPHGTALEQVYGYVGRHLAAMLGEDYAAMSEHERGHWDAIAGETIIATAASYDLLGLNDDPSADL